MSIYVSKFNPKHKDTIVKEVIAHCKHKGVLEGIVSNYSAEQGFTLNCNRQIRFYQDDMNNIDRMYIKDNAYFEQEELDIIKEYVNESVLVLHDNEIKYLPIPTNSTEININPFDEKYKEQVMELVINICQLKDIKKNYSAEGGFELPMGDWNKVELKNKNLLKYHNCRQLRFRINGNIVYGLRLKDNINYMTVDELNTIRECVNNASNM
jgi:hypothetical protein